MANAPGNPPDLGSCDVVGAEAVNMPEGVVVSGGVGRGRRDGSDGCGRGRSSGRSSYCRDGRWPFNLIKEDRVGGLGDRRSGRCRKSKGTVVGETARSVHPLPMPTTRLQPLRVEETPGVFSGTPNLSCKL